MSKIKEYGDKVAKYGKKYLTLLEMKKVDFHPDAEKAFEIYEQNKEEIADLNQKINAIQHKVNKNRIDIAALKEEITEERKKESKLKRKQLREERLAQAEERKKKWGEKLKSSVVTVGKYYSYELNDLELNEEKLNKYNVPKLKTIDDLLELLEIDLPKLKYLTFHRNAANFSHYYYFEIPKKNGRMRKISAPKTELNRVQQIIYEKILKNIPVHDAAHGFLENKSILTNAEAHYKGNSEEEKLIVINMDLKDFFPSIFYPRIVGLFKQIFGYSGEISTFLAMLCSEPQRAELTIKGKQYFVAKDMRHLPQGASTSPMLTNILCWKLDNRLKGLAKLYNFTYTRYADDITFSGTDNTKIGKLIGGTKFIIKDEGFSTNPKKTRILRYNRRQSITGIVVNDIINPPKSWLKILRAELHSLHKHVENNSKKPISDELTEKLMIVAGKISYLNMINSEKSKKYSNELNKIYDLLS